MKTSIVFVSLILPIFVQAFELTANPTTVNLAPNPCISVGQTSITGQFHFDKDSEAGSIEVTLMKRVICGPTSRQIEGYAKVQVPNVTFFVDENILYLNADGQNYPVAHHSFLFGWNTNKNVRLSYDLVSVSKNQFIVTPKINIVE